MVEKNHAHKRESKAQTKASFDSRLLPKTLHVSAQVFDTHDWNLYELQKKKNVFTTSV